MKTQNSGWPLCIVGTIALCILSFTPLVIPAGENGPFLLGMPRTLWLGIVVYGLMVLITYVATRVHPEANEEEGDSE